MAKRINRAQLRGKPLEWFCKSAVTTTHEYSVTDERVFCTGMINLMDDEPLDECIQCGAFIRNMKPPKEEEHER